MTSKLPKIGTVGHYHVPSIESGYCHAALVVGSYNQDSVNLTVWSHRGMPDPRDGVAVQLPHKKVRTFHLKKACPWDR